MTWCLFFYSVAVSHCCEIIVLIEINCTIPPKEYDGKGKKGRGIVNIVRAFLNNMIWGLIGLRLVIDKTSKTWFFFGYQKYIVLCSYISTASIFCNLIYLVGGCYWMMCKYRSDDETSQFSMSKTCETQHYTLLLLHYNSLHDTTIHFISSEHFLFPSSLRKCL